MIGRVWAPVRGALRVRMADGETCHADELADLLAELATVVHAERAPGLGGLDTAVYGFAAVVVDVAAALGVIVELGARGAGDAT